MDVFELRDTVVADYSSYVRSFVTIRDEHINRFVDERLNEGRLWPNPLVQLNPAFGEELHPRTSHRQGSPS